MSLLNLTAEECAKDLLKKASNKRKCLKCVLKKVQEKMLGKMNATSIHTGL